MNMKLAPLANDGNKGPDSKPIAESLELLDELSAEIRTISHLLHPPLLDEVGLSSALRLYLEGFAERSRVNVNLEIPSDFGRLSRELETAVFRIVQECVTNIHRHSGSAVARILISRSDHYLRVEVQDEGKGISPLKRAEIELFGKAGVGLRGMRERIRQLAGTLEIGSPANGKGTVVIARLPVEQSSVELSR
jgi:signal transduction histidine kinase